MEARIGLREDWASQGVILVTITYRLGVMGFFSHPLLSKESSHGVSGNYGLLDQIAGLKWVHNNIEAFGGDPENISLFGQSAGAGSVKALCSSPLSKDLISHAIIMSGGGLNESRPSTLLDTAALTNREMMAHFGKNTLDEMRELSYDEIMKMSKQYSDSTNNDVSWRPVIDGYLMNASFTDMALADKIADIPYLIGFTSNDMSNMTDAVRDFSSLRTKESNKPVYAYLFQRQLPGDESGAFHSADLWYVFHSLGHSWRPFTAGDEALSNKIVNYWTNFVKFGDPNGKEDVSWTPYTDELPEFMVLDANGNQAICTMSSTPKYGGSSFR